MICSICTDCYAATDALILYVAVWPQKPVHRVSGRDVHAKSLCASCYAKWAGATLARTKPAPRKRISSSSSLHG